LGVAVLTSQAILMVLERVEYGVMLEAARGASIISIWRSPSV
jgi:hypothetical protein